MEHDITQIAEEAIRERDGTGLWDVLRTISGLIAALAIVAIVASTVAQSEPRQSASPITPPPAATTNVPERHVLIVSGPRKHPLHVFYLVQTPEQEDLVHWAENEGANDAANAGVAYTRPSYDVLYIRSEEEQQIAAQKILEEMLDFQELVLVEVVDMRPVADIQLR